MENVSQSANQPTNDFIEIKDLLEACKQKWYWFVLSLLITLSVAAIYILCTPPSYLRTAQVQIKSESKGNSIAGAAEAIENLGLVTTNTSVNNELLAMLSPDVMEEVVNRLNLHIDYNADGFFHNRVLYGSSLPIKVVLTDLDPLASASFDIQQAEGTSFEISNFTLWLNGEKTTTREALTGNFNDTLETPVGHLVVSPTLNFSNTDFPMIHVSVSNKQIATETYLNKLSIVLAEDKSEVITISVNDLAPQRADDVISTLIAVYNENWVNDKNQIAISTSLFINDRLKVIESELSDVDNDISQYKSKNLLPDVKAAAELYMQQSTAIGTQIQDLSNQRYMMRYIHDYLALEENSTKLLPVSSGISNANIENQISQYNEKLLQRNRLEANSSAQNALVVELDNDLAVMRSAIVVSIDNQIVSIDNQINSLERSERDAIARIASNPEQAKTLLSVERQQAVKEALYVFLLQKREETELTQAFTAYNTRIIKRPGGSIKPCAPVKRNILMVALAIGLMIPLAIIYLRESLTTTIRGKKDLERMKAPLIGEIPNALPSKPWWKFWQKDAKCEMVVVKPSKRDVINEAFRVLRTNIEFMANGSQNVIMVTSFNAGSGKSFISANIGISLAIKGKKLLLIDGDLRHASLSALANTPQKGLSDYLNGQEKNIQSLLVNLQNGLDLLPVGTIPPNPSELIGNELFKQLIDQLRSQYDYIFIDCPPVDIVADAHLIEKVADRTLFIIRAELLERSMLSELDQLYTNNKLKNLSVVLNGTSATAGKYAYRYGYYHSYTNAAY